MADSLRNGIVITGGGANTGNIASYIKELSGYNVRTGYARNKFSASGCNGVYSTSATTSIGMILAAKNDELPSCIESLEINEETRSDTSQEARDKELSADWPAVQGENDDTLDETDTNLFGEKIKSKRDNNKAKDKKDNKKLNLSVKWKKKFNELVGNLYDNMGNESV